MATVAAELECMTSPIRIGVLSDLHYERAPTGPRSAINRYEQELVAERLEAAVEIFREAGIHSLVLLGDVTELADGAALDLAFSILSRAGAPIGVVAGNHDERFGGSPLDRDGVTALGNTALRIGAVQVSGVAIAPAEPGLPLFESRAVPELDATTPLSVVASHYPVLSQAPLLAGAGLPYYGDLIDRSTLASALCASTRPVVVLNGHIHARCTATCGPLLQLSVGALVEPPFDCTIVEITTQDEVCVERRATRLGRVSLINPVFAADEERWRFDGDYWRESLKS